MKLIVAAEGMRLRGGGGKTLLGRALQAGTMEHGYYGEYTAEEVIAGQTLWSLAQGTGGSTINSTQGWLGFALNGKQLLIAKKPFRTNTTWDHLNSRGLVRGKQVSFKDHTWLCRLPFGANRDPVPTPVGEDLEHSHGSEWNRLMYHVAATGTLTSEGILTGDWAQFSDDDLGIYSDSVNAYSLCQESVGSNCVIRGRYSVSYIWRNQKASHAAWRPVLELVE